MRPGLASALVAAALLVACTGGLDDESPSNESRSSSPVALEVQPLPSPPSAAGALAPTWASDRRLAWLEPLPEEPGHRLRTARLEEAGWSAASTVVAGDDLFANWADMPAVAVDPSGGLVAHWLAKLGAGTYAYGVQLARSGDDGASWQRLGLLHDDASPTEHGFVSWVAEPEEGGGGLRAFWLDGREMAAGGPMALRTVALGTGKVGASELLDERVCECCQTDAAWTDEGPLVVYRDRSEGEVRDIFLIRRTADGWSAPVAVHHDGWEIAGCPVNGPAVAAAGVRVVVAWFTVGRGKPRVQVAMSEDGGRSFRPPVVLDANGPLGRVDVTWARDGEALVSWLGAGVRSGVAEIRVAAVSSSGEVVAAASVAETSAARSSGFPRLARQGSEIWLAWRETEKEEAPARLRAARMRVGQRPVLVSAQRAGGLP